MKVLSTGTNIPAEQLNAMKTYLAAGVDVLMFDPIDSSAIAPRFGRRTPPVCR